MTQNDKGNLDMSELNTKLVQIKGLVLSVIGIAAAALVCVAYIDRFIVRVPAFSLDHTGLLYYAAAAALVSWGCR